MLGRSQGPAGARGSVFRGSLWASLRAAKDAAERPAPIDPERSGAERKGQSCRSMWARKRWRSSLAKLPHRHAEGELSFAEPSCLESLEVRERSRDSNSGSNPSLPKRSTSSSRTPGRRPGTGSTWLFSLRLGVPAPWQPGPW